MERYSELLSSNSPPELAEIVAIQEDINTRAKRVGRLQLELQRIDAERRRIEEECLRAQEEHDALRGLLSPLRRFPAEILSEIFMVAYSDVVHRSHDPEKGPGCVVKLCRVSKHWREVAIGTPLLWSSLTLLPELKNEGCLNIGKISNWMGRSADIARHLEFGQLYNCYHGIEEDCRLLHRWSVAKLLSEGPKIHSLHLNAVSPECVHELAKHMKDQRADATRPWDLLKSLALSLVYRGRPSAPVKSGSVAVGRYPGSYGNIR